MENEQRLEHLPITIFATVMGLSGLALAWRGAQQVMNFDIGALNHVLVAMPVLVFGFLATFYLLKLIRYPSAVAQEAKHPVKISFFATISVSILLLSVVLMPYSKQVSLVLWGVGVLVQLGLLLFIVNSWVNHEHFETVHINPAWFIPAVGNVVVPIGGVEHGFVEVSWFFFSVGMIFWLVLFTIIFNRILFHNPLPPRLLPTLAILIAPPAVGFLSLLKLTGGLDTLTRVLFYGGMFFTLFLFTQVARLMKLPFFLSSWAYSFPLAAITLACLRMHKLTGSLWVGYAAMGLLAVLTLIIAWLVFRTVIAAINRKICVPE